MNLNELGTDVYLDQQYFIPVATAYAKLSDVLDSMDMPSSISVLDDTIYYTYNDSIEEELPSFNLFEGFPRNSINIKPFDNVPAGVNLSIPTDSVIPSQIFTLTVPVEIDSAFNDQQIDSISFKSARIAVQLNTSQISNFYPANTRITINFLKNIVFSDGTKQKVVVPSVFGQDEYIQLNNFYVDCRDKSYEITFEVKVEFLQNRTQNIVVNRNSSMSLAMELQNPDFEAVYGVFNFSDFNGESIVNLPLGDYFPGSILKFADATISMKTMTNAGVNLVFNIDEFGIITGDNSVTKINYADFNGSRILSTTLDKPSKLQDVAYTSIPEINNENGHLDDVFDSDYALKALKLKYSFTKPSVLKLPEFLVENTFFKLKYQFKTPLYFNDGSNLKFSTYITGTQEVFEKILMEDTIQRVGLVFDFENEFPVDLVLNLEYVDNRGIVKNLILAKDTAFHSTFILEAPEVDEKGIVIRDSIAVQRMFMEFNKINYETLKSIDRINLTFNLKTDVDKPMFFTTQDKVTVKLGAYAKGDYLVEF